MRYDGGGELTSAVRLTYWRVNEVMRSIIAGRRCGDLKIDGAPRARSSADICQGSFHPPSVGISSPLLGQPNSTNLANAVIPAIGLNRPAQAIVDLTSPAKSPKPQPL